MHPPTDNSNSLIEYPHHRQLHFLSCAFLYPQSAISYFHHHQALSSIGSATCTTTWSLARLAYELHRPHLHFRLEKKKNQNLYHSITCFSRKRCSIVPILRNCENHTPQSCESHVSILQSPSIVCSHQDLSTYTTHHMVACLLAIRALL